MSFHHGIEHVWLKDPEGKPIRLSRSSVIGLVATASDADADAFPLHKPALVTSPKMLAKAGVKGTLRPALKDIFRQSGATVVVVRVPTQSDEAAQASEIIGKISPETGEYEGMKALQLAESSLGIKPRLLIAPDFINLEGVAVELDALAEKLHGIAIVDASAAGYESWLSEKTGLKSSYFIAGGVRVIGDDGKAIERPASPTAAGHIAGLDDTKDASHSPSNKPLKAVLGPALAIDHSITDKNARSNFLNERNIACVIRDSSGVKLWGNRLADGRYVSHVRVRFLVGDAIVAAHQEFLDEKITTRLIGTIQGRINSFLRRLQSREMISGGRAWLDQELNAESIKIGQLVWDYDLGLYGIAENLVFRQAVNHNYNAAILGA